MNTAKADPAVPIRLRQGAGGVPSRLPERTGRFHRRSALPRAALQSAHAARAADERMRIGAVAGRTFRACVATGMAGK